MLARWPIVGLLAVVIASSAGCSADAMDGEEANADESALTSISLDVPLVLQKPELPRGCEVTSLAMLLRHAGVKADKMTLASQVKKVPYLANGVHGDPYEGFVGNMTDFAQQGYGVYHGPIKALAEQYLPGRIADLTGASFDDVLQAHVARKRPVWVVTNATFKPLDAAQFQTWQTKSGSARITWHEHSVVITGFDATTVTINDPLDAAHGKMKKLARADFRVAWEQMGKQALTYLPASAPVPPLASQTTASCAGVTIPRVPTTRGPADLAPYDLTASHAIAWTELRPGDALNRNVAGSTGKHVAFFAGWADAAKTTACVVQPSAGTTATANAYGASARAELTPIRFESAPGGWRSAPIGVDCSVHADGRLYCTNTGGAAMHAEPNATSATVNHLRTSYSWFECWQTGERHAGGNTTWYRTQGDDNASKGFLPGVNLSTPDDFDADPSARGLRKCQP